MTCAEFFLMISQTADRSGMAISRPLVESIINQEIRIILAKSPIEVSLDVTLDTNGEYAISSGELLKVREVYHNGRKLGQTSDPDQQERM